MSPSKFPLPKITKAKLNNLPLPKDQPTLKDSFTTSATQKWKQTLNFPSPFLQQSLNQTVDMESSPESPKMTRPERRDVFGSSDTDDEEDLDIGLFTFACCSSYSAKKVSSPKHYTESSLPPNSSKLSSSSCNYLQISFDNDFEISENVKIMSESFSQTLNSDSFDSNTDSDLILTNQKCGFNSKSEDGVRNGKPVKGKLDNELDSKLDDNSNQAPTPAGADFFKEQKMIEETIKQKREQEEIDRKLALKLQRRLQKDTDAELRRRPDGYGTRSSSSVPSQSVNSVSSLDLDSEKNSSSRLQCPHQPSEIENCSFCLLTFPANKRRSLMFTPQGKRRVMKRKSSSSAVSTKRKRTI